MLFREQALATVAWPRLRHQRQLEGPLDVDGHLVAGDDVLGVVGPVEVAADNALLVFRDDRSGAT